MWNRKGCDPIRHHLTISKKMNDKTSEYQQADCILYIKVFNRSDASIWNFFVAEAQTFPNRSYRWVDARDVVNAHIQAYEIPKPVEDNA